MNLKSMGRIIWLKKKRFWFILTAFVMIFLFIWSLPSELPSNIVQIGKAYSEPEIYENAMQLARENHRVREVLGELNPMGPMSLIEGSVRYSRGGDSVAITINIKGDKSNKRINSKLDIRAHRKNNKWEYQKLQIRIKNPVEMRETIPIFKK